MRAALISSEWVARIVDDGDFFEVHEHWAQNIICGFSRLDGYPVGIVPPSPRRGWV